jgi:Tuberculosis necrotizing toxin
VEPADLDLSQRLSLMKRFLPALFLAFSLLGVSHPEPSRAQSAAEVGGAPAGFPANLRWELVPKWIKWADAKADISWPPNDGCAAAPVAQSLAGGEMIDRFGSEGGTFFSPRGESYRSRAVPYVCRQMDYRVYRVVKPIAVKSCKAASWFGEPGGAIQVQTTEPAFKLVADGKIEVVSYAAGGSGGAAPQCGRP